MTMYTRFAWFLCPPQRHSKLLRLHQWSKSPDLEPCDMGAVREARRIFAGKYVDKDTLVGERQMFAIFRRKANI